MTFTATQRTLAYELLGLFQGGTFDWYDYNDFTTGEIASVPITQQIDFTVAVTRVNAIFAEITAAVGANEDRETRIGEVLSRYSLISLEDVRVKGGGTAGTPGARYSTDEHIAHLRKLLWTHMGVRVLVHNAPGQGGGGRNIPVGR